MGIDSDCVIGYGTVVCPASLDEETRKAFDDVMEWCGDDVVTDSYQGENPIAFLPAQDPERPFVSVDRRPFVINSDVAGKMGTFRTGEISEGMWEAQEDLGYDERYILLDQLDEDRPWLPRDRPLPQEVLESCHDYLLAKHEERERNRKPSPWSDHDQPPDGRQVGEALAQVLSSPTGLIPGKWLIYVNT